MQKYFWDNRQKFFFCPFCQITPGGCYFHSLLSLHSLLNLLHEIKVRVLNEEARLEIPLSTEAFECGVSRNEEKRLSLLFAHSVKSNKHKLVLKNRGEKRGREKERTQKGKNITVFMNKFYFVSFSKIIFFLRKNKKFKKYEGKKRAEQNNTFALLRILLLSCEVAQGYRKSLYFLYYKLFLIFLIFFYISNYPPTPLNSKISLSEYFNNTKKKC